MNIIVTGASQGIGYELVKHLAKEKNNTVLAVARSMENLLRLQKECNEQSKQDNVPVLALDLANDNLEDILLPGLRNFNGKIDILVNNAGLMIHKPFEQLDEEDFNRIFNANVRSIFSLTRLLLPYFSINAHIVNIGSMGGVQGSAKFPGLSLYSASKGAVAILTECLAEELKDRKISVNCLALGSAQTEMLSEAFPGYKSPLTAAEMAEYIAGFALNGHRWFNGKVLPVAVSTP